MSLQSFKSALRIQAAACKDLGSPFTARILTVIAENSLDEGEAWELMATWPGELGPSGDSIPLRLAGTLHAIVLEGWTRTLLLYIRQIQISTKIKISGWRLKMPLIVT
ncbi:MAG: DUF2332 family protein [Sneathiella sp.]|nr:DUF2332 family protein [Sneathiella sp.]